MEWSEYLASLGQNSPPECQPIMKSLWWDRKGNWEKAHNIAQDIHTSDGSWIHAYLHRKEGDIWNADYWYAKADKSRPETSLDEEWESLVRHFLN